MTFQPPSPTHDNNNDNKAEEASSLLHTVAEEDRPTTKKKNGGVPTMRAMIVTTCFVLGTLAVIYSGGSGSGRNTSSGVLSAALVRGHTQAAPVYDNPSDNDFCLHDNRGESKYYHNPYCWYPTQDFPFGNPPSVYPGVFGVNCYQPCTDFDASDPNQDFCLEDMENAGQDCWYPTKTFPFGGDSREVTPGVYQKCGPQCTGYFPSDQTAVPPGCNAKKNIHDVGVTDAACAACQNGQIWWPCNLDPPMCEGAGCCKSKNFQGRC